MSMLQAFMMGGVVGGGGGGTPIPTANLVGHWDGDNVSGTTMSDLVGTRDITLAGSPGIVSGLVGNAVDMDGVDDTALTSGNNIVTGYFTVVALIRVPSAGGGTLSARVTQGRDGFGSGWNIQLLTSATVLNGYIVTSSPLAQRTLPNYNYPSSIADTWTAVWMRFRPSNLEAGFNTNTVRTGVSFSATGLRTSSFGFFFGTGSTFVPVKSAYEKILLYNTNLSDSVLQQALDAVRGV